MARHGVFEVSGVSKKVYHGEGLVLSRSVRRVGTSWRTHLSFCLNFNFFCCDYKSGFGGCIMSTKARLGNNVLGV